MTRRYFIVQDGERLYADTKAGIQRLAQWAADSSRQAVAVHREKAARPLRARRNPEPGDHVDHFLRMHRVREELAAAKRQAAKEKAAEISRKYVVDAVSRKDRYSLTRKGKAAAERLADEFKRAGYRVTISAANPRRRTAAKRKTAPKPTRRVRRV